MQVVLKTRDEATAQQIYSAVTNCFNVSTRKVDKIHIASYGDYYEIIIEVEDE